MRYLLLLSVIAACLSTSAQPAKDSYDALGAAHQHERDLQPAITQARENAAALRALLRAEQKLGDDSLPAGSALDAAISLIDQYMHELDVRKGYLPRDVRRIVEQMRDVLDQARTPMPSDNTLLIDKVHHQFIHRLSRRVMEEMTQINALITTYAQIEVALRALQTLELQVLSNSENVTGLPQPRPVQ